MNSSARAGEGPDDDIYLRPLFLCRVQAGLPSPADDHVDEERLNLNRFIFRNPSSTILHRIEDDSLEGFGIFKGDILVIDMSPEFEEGHLLLVEVGGKKVIRLAVKLRGGCCFPAEVLIGVPPCQPFSKQGWCARPHLGIARRNILRGRVPLP